MSDRYAVFGHPISHSQSPRIHSLFAKQTGERLEYTARDVRPEDFEKTVREFLSAGGRGLNCTVPLKELAFQLADRLSERAQRSKAVNTLALQTDGCIDGDNTDGVGLVNDLTGNLGFVLAGRRVLILGAGGATRGIIGPILELKPGQLTIANRTADKAVQLAREFSDVGAPDGCGLDDLGGTSFDVILNATSASLAGDLPELPEALLASDGICYDLAYGKEPTPFVRWGKQAGASASVDGIGMLVEQAAEAFFLWRNIRPMTAPVISALNAARNIDR